MFIGLLKNRPINFLRNLKKTNPKIMILGPGDGEYILDLHKTLNKLNINPEIDVLGLSNSITSKVKKKIRTDYSQGISFEELWNYPEKYKSIIRDFLGKYDLIEASYSTGYHTNYSEKTSFYTALMLAPQGEAYVLIRPESVSSLNNKFNKFNKKYELPFGVLHHGQKTTIMYIKDYLQRAVKVYNKKYGTNLEFELDIINKKDGDFYLIIKRIN